MKIDPSGHAIQLNCEPALYITNAHARFITFSENALLLSKRQKKELLKFKDINDQVDQYTSLIKRSEQYRDTLEALQDLLTSETTNVHQKAAAIIASSEIVGHHPPNIDDQFNFFAKAEALGAADGLSGPGTEDPSPLEHKLKALETTYQDETGRNPSKELTDAYTRGFKHNAYRVEHLQEEGSVQEKAIEDWAVTTVENL